MAAPSTEPSATIASDSRWEPEHLMWWVAQRLAVHRNAPELERFTVIDFVDRVAFVVDYREGM